MLQKYHTKNTVEVGCDEAGRGCLAGPVFAAAVIINKDFDFVNINDSKKISEKERFKLRELIEEKTMWFVASCSSKEIDSMNILNASILAMHRAIHGLSQKYEIQPEHIIVDGNRFKTYQKIPHKTIVKGDGKYVSIASASILAKTHRDEYMTKLHQKYAEYGWDVNKGYPTIKHREAIINQGPCEFHRKTFKLIPSQIKLF